MRQFLQRFRATTKRIQFCAGAADQFTGHAHGFFHTKKRGISRLFYGGIFAGGLAQLLGGLRDVESVVGDLEGQAGLLSEAADAADASVISSGI